MSRLYAPNLKDLFDPNYTAKVLIAWRLKEDMPSKFRFTCYGSDGDVRVHQAGRTYDAALANAPGVDPSYLARFLQDVAAVKDLASLYGPLSDLPVVCDPFTGHGLVPRADRPGADRLDDVARHNGRFLTAAWCYVRELELAGSRRSLKGVGRRRNGLKPVRVKASAFRLEVWPDDNPPTGSLTLFDAAGAASAVYDVKRRPLAELAAIGEAHASIGGGADPLTF